MTAQDIINPAVMITHIGGLDAVSNTILDLPNITGGKKLIYPHIDMPLIDIRNLSDLEKTDKRYKELAKILDQSNRIWSLEAEKFILKSF